jgi:hypothetical protein
MNKVTKIMAGVVAIGAVAVPAALVVPALASTTPTTTTVASATTPTTTPGSATPATAGADGRGQHRGQKLLRRAAVNKVAAQLGITPDALRAAVKDARTNHKPAQPLTDQTARRQYWLGQVADELHITPDKLQAAVKAARQEIRTELLGS